jgi:hypothetical protein
MSRVTITALAVLTLALSTGCSTTTTRSPEAAPAVDPGAPAPSAAPEPVQPPEPEEPPVNTVKWTTASEVDNYGFDIYRSLSEDGPFERINDELIAGAGTTDEPQSYVFVDDTIDPAKGYWYYIESISIDGVRERFSPITYVKPKRPQG